MMLNQNLNLYLPKLLSVSLCGSIVFHIFGLLRYPAPTCDEVFYIRTSLAYGEALRAGHIWPPLTSISLITHGRLYWFLSYLVISLIGKNFVASRFIAFIGIVLLILMTYSMGKLYTTHSIAKWASILLGFTGLTIFSGHLGRPDVWVAACIIGTICLVEIGRTQNTRLGYFILGLLLCLQTDIHMNALHFILPISLITLLHIKNKGAWSQGLSFLAGLVLGAIWVLISHNIFLLQIQTSSSTPTNFLKTYIGFKIDDLFFVMASSIITFWQKYYLGFIPWLSIPQAMMFLMGLLFAPFTSNNKLKTLWTITILSTLSFGIINQGYQLPGYALLWLPLYILIGVASLEEILIRVNKTGINFLPYILSILVITNILSGLYLIRQDYVKTYYRTARQILEQIPDGKKIMGHEIWWFAANDRLQFLDEAILLPARTDMWWYSFPEYTEIQANLFRQNPLPDEELLIKTQWEALAPDFFLDDSLIGCFYDTTSSITNFLSSRLEEQCVPIQHFQFIEFANIMPLGASQVLYKCN